MMKKAIYPGTFDPVTFGHLDVIERSLKLFDEVLVGVTTNPKKTPFFSIKERKKFLEESLKGKKRVKIKEFDSLLVDFAEKENCGVIIKGLREVSDFTQEFQQAIVNRKLKPEMETVLIITNPKYFYLNSSIVREIAKLRGCVKGFVPEFVEKALKNKMK